MSNEFNTKYFNNITDDSKLFKSVYGINPSDTLNESKTSITVPYAWWTISSYVPIIRKEDTEPASLEERKAFIIKALTGKGDANINDYYYIDGVVSETVNMDLYSNDPGYDIFHPTAVQWSVAGHKAGKAKVYYIGSPYNRAKLYSLTKKLGRFPTTKDFNIVSESFDYGVFTPYKGFIHLDGLSSEPSKKRRI